MADRLPGDGDQRSDDMSALGGSEGGQMRALGGEPAEAREAPGQNVLPPRPEPGPSGPPAPAATLDEMPDDSAAKANLFVGSIPPQWTEATLQELFGAFGTVRSTLIARELRTGRSRGYGFVNMDSPEAAAEALRVLDGRVVSGKKLSVRAAACDPVGGRQADRHGAGSDAGPNDNLYVKGVPSSWSDKQLTDLFQTYGSVRHLRILTPPGGGASVTTAMVQMGSVPDATAARDALHGSMPPGCAEPLLVRFARNRHQPKPPKPARRPRLPWSAPHSPSGFSIPLGVPVPPLHPAVVPGMVGPRTLVGMGGLTAVPALPGGIPGSLQPYVAFPAYFPGVAPQGGLDLAQQMLVMQSLAQGTHPSLSVPAALHTPVPVTNVPALALSAVNSGAWHAVTHGMLEAARAAATDDALVAGLQALRVGVGAGVGGAAPSDTAVPAPPPATRLGAYAPHASSPMDPTALVAQLPALSGTVLGSGLAPTSCPPPGTAGPHAPTSAGTPRILVPGSADWFDDLQAPHRP